MGGRQEGLLCLVRQLGNGAAHLQKLCFGLAHQFHDDFALSPALAAKATPALLAVFFEASGLGLQRGGSGGALLGNVLNELEDFF
jgi:hypothetical protein